MKNKKKKSKGLFYIILIIFIIGILFYNYNLRKVVPENRIIKEETTPSQITEIKKEGLNPDSFVYAVVSRVVDGDTIIVNYKNSNYRVRLLDIDTPESVKEGVPIQPYAKESSQFTQKSLLYKKVKLVFEKSLRDKYGRLLAHILLMNNSYFNAVLVRNGFARVEIIKPNDLYKDFFNKLQDLAIQDNLGVWSLKGEKKPFIMNSYGDYVPRYLN